MFERQQTDRIQAAAAAGLPYSIGAESGAMLAHVPGHATPWTLLDDTGADCPAVVGHYTSLSEALAAHDTWAGA